jgi:hypothetical protein
LGKLFGHGVESLNVPYFPGQGLFSGVPHHQEHEAVAEDEKVDFFPLRSVADFHGSGHLPKIGEVKIFRAFADDSADVPNNMVMPFAKMLGNLKGSYCRAAIDEGDLRRGDQAGHNEAPTICELHLPKIESAGCSHGVGPLPAFSLRLDISGTPGKYDEIIP